MDASHIIGVQVLANIISMNKTDNQHFLRNRASLEFMTQWEQLNTGFTADNVEQIIEQIKISEQIQNHSNRAIVLFSPKDFKPLYWGGNFEKLFGYTPSEINLWNISLFFKSIVWEHIDFPLHIIKWNKIIDRLSPMSSENLPARSYFCGIKMKHKDGHTLRIFVDQTILAVKNNQASLCLFFIEDIQHLMKDSFYWVRYVRKRSAYATLFLRSSGQKKKFQDILSPREKEILIEISKGADSKEISKKLNISPATVTTHRKNMIARSGAKNTTALVQLCKMCNAI